MIVDNSLYRWKVEVLSVRRLTGEELMMMLVMQEEEVWMRRRVRIPLEFTFTKELLFPITIVGYVSSSHIKTHDSVIFLLFVN